MNRKLLNEELNRPDAMQNMQQEKMPVVVVLEDIRSMHNIGSVFRTCDAMMVQEVVLIGITAQPPHRDIHKTALGATESVKWSYYETFEAYCATLDRTAVTVIALEQAENKVFLHDFEPDFQATQYILVFGNEVEGVRQETINASNTIIEIPQFGMKHSLNISVTTGVVLWHFLRKYIAG